jgi:uncharacterized metal-binding protein
MFVSLLETLDVKLKIANPDDLKKWMTDYVKGLQVVLIQKDVYYETEKYDINTLLEEVIHNTEQVTFAAKKSLPGGAAKLERLGRYVCQHGCDPKETLWHL